MSIVPPWTRRASSTAALFFRISALLLAPFIACAAEDPFPELYNSEKSGGELTPPDAALKSLTLPPGFKATMWAHEPAVQNPIAMAWDPAGRMYVAENYTYAERQIRFDMKLRDRVIILEDKDGDGVAETRRVFTDNVQMLTGIEVGRGGVWLMTPPQLIFIPDANGDGIPDGPPQVMLDGFTVAKDNYHNFANGLRWGPDGWLYGRCGASCPGDIGLPGTPPDRRIPLRGTMWRYHPGRKTVEVLSHGTTNPWGHDWDKFGELFFINTVNGHLWHGITGAHFVRPHTLDPNPNAYFAIDMHADHWHFDTGKGWQASRDGKANDLGGGHAHCGAMIYQGDRWPEQYRNQLFTLNFHGRRANVELLERQGSGYVAHHGPDTFFFGDPWFRGIDIQQGPDGAAYVLDWSDAGECHDSTGVHRTSGRIYKIDYAPDGKREPLPKFEKATQAQLVAMLADPDAWRSRMAQRTLEDRSAAGVKISPKPLEELFDTAQDAAVRGRAMRLLFTLGLADAEWLKARLYDEDEHIRAWAIRLLTDEYPLDWISGPSPEITKEFPYTPDFVEVAGKDASGLVRLALASALQRMPVGQRAELARVLVANGDDANDHNLPAIVWYGMMPVGDSDPKALVSVGEASEWPTETRWIARRLAVASEKTPAALSELVKVLAKRPAALQASMVQGASDGFQGWRKAAKPDGWDALLAKLEPKADDATKANLRDLGVLFGDGRSLDEVKRVALDDKAEIAVRAAALRTLIDARPPDLRQICEKLLDVKYLNVTAARGLATFDDPAVGTLLADNIRKFHPGDRQSVIEVLVTRAPWAMALLEQVRKTGIQRSEISAFHARQMRNLGDAQLTEKLTAMWGEMREGSADKQAAIAKLRPDLTAELLAKSDAGKGRQTFSQVCAVCHTLYGEGGKIGPDLTGANRQNLDYLLENIIDPSAVVTADFRVSLLTLKDGRVLSGMITATNDKTVTLKTLTESTTIERAEVTKTEVLPASMMPEGLLQAFPPEGVRDLFKYLMSTQQVAMPGAAK